MIEKNLSDELTGPKVKPGLMLKWGGHPNGTLIIYGESLSQNGVREYSGIALITTNFFNKIRPKKQFDYGWQNYFTIDFLKQWRGGKMLNKDEFYKKRTLLFHNPILISCISGLIKQHEEGNQLYYQHPDFEKILHSPF